MAEQGFTLFSPAFENDAEIPGGHTCDSHDTSPALKWMHAPAGTKSFALIMDDPDAPRGTFTHWVLFDIPGSADQIPEGDGSVGVGGRNDFHATKYGGPCPPPNHPHHRYYFTLYALDVESLDLSPGVPRGEVERAMSGHILGQTQMMGRYQRRTG